MSGKVIRLLLGGWIAAAIAVLTLGVLPYDAVRPLADALASDGRADDFTPALHAAVSGRLVLLGLLLLAVGATGGIVSRNRTRMRKEVSEFAEAVARHARWAFIDAGPAIQLSLALTLIAGVVLRLWFLDAPLWNDEASEIVDRASLPLLKGLSTPASRYHSMAILTMHVSTGLFGLAEWAIRLPMLIAGIAVIPLSYWAGSALFDRRAACIGTALAAVAHPLVAYSINGRGYAFGNICLLVMIALVPWLAKTRNLAAAALFAVAAAVANFSVQSMVYAYVVAICFLGLTMLQRDGARAIGGIVLHCTLISGAAVVATLLLYSPFWLRLGLAELTFSGIVLGPERVFSTAEITAR